MKKYLYILCFLLSAMMAKNVRAQEDVSLRITPVRAVINTVTSFNVDIYNPNVDVASMVFAIKLPVGCTFVDKEGYHCSLTERAGNAFVVDDNYVVANNTLYVVVNGMGQVLNGKDGSMATFQFQTSSDAASGVIEVSNLSWSNADGTKGGNLPDFSVDITVADSYYLGDVNKDNKVNVTDAVDIVNDRLGYESLNFDKSLSDVNKDALFTIADAIAVINIMYGEPIDVVNEARLSERREEMIKLYQSEENVLSIDMVNFRNYSAFEFDMELPEGVSVEEISINEQRCNNFRVQYNELNTGQFKVVAFNFDNEAFTTGEGNIMKIFTRGTAIVDNVKLKNIHFSTDRAIDVAFGEVDLTSEVTGVGMISLDGNSYTPSYNLQGQRIKASAHGIVIMHGKKVFIK